MRKKLLMVIALLVSGVGNLWAQTVPVFKELDSFGGTAVSSLTTFVPNGTTYTLELTGCTADTEITVPGGSFSYTPTTSGTVRFVRFGSTVYVYEGTTYKGTVEVSTPEAPTYPNIYGDTDDSSTNTGIYSENNIFRNPGFETKGDKLADNQYKAVNWDANGYTYKDRSRVRDNANLSGQEGSCVFLIHGYGNPADYLSQELIGLDNFTPYQVKFKIWFHQTSACTYSATVGTSVGNGALYQGEVSTPGSGSADRSFTFTTDALTESNYYFTLTRKTSSRIGNFDRMTLVAANGGGIGITGATGATFLPGSAYAPEGVLAAEVAAERYGNATMRVTNPNFDDGITGWESKLGVSSNTVKESDDSKTGTTKFWENWNASAKEGRMLQVISDLPSGTYELQIMAFADQIGTMTPASTSVAVYAQGQEVGTSSSSYVRPNYVNSIEFTNYKTYAYVDATGKLEIGMRQYSPAEFRWLCMDNVTLKYIATDNQEEAKMLALYQDKWTAVKAALKEDLDASTYEHITGDERTDFSDDIADGVTVSALADYKTNADAAKSTRVTFIADATKNAYDEYYYENQTATRLGADVSEVIAPTTAADATTAAHAINVINYNKFIAEEYADVSETVLGDWTDTNVYSRTGEHWDGSTGGDGSPYFEQNEGWSSATVWSMSRQQTVELAAGSYVLKVAARAAAGVNAELSVKVGENDPIVTYVHHHGGIGKGIDTSGEANFGEGTFANTTGRCWEWRYIPFTVESTSSVTLKFNAENTSGLINQYVSFCNLGIWTDPKVAARTALLTAISNATSARNSTNEGDGVFQIPSAAGTTLAKAISTAQGVYDNDEATPDQINAATIAMTGAQTTYEGITLNAPTAGQRIRIVNCTSADDFDFSGNALTFYANPSQTEGGYSYQYRLAPNDAYAQNFIFTPVAGQNNQYIMSFIDSDGTTRYVCSQYGYYENASGDKNRIRSTTNSEYALKVRVDVTTTANVWKLYNTEAEKNIGTNGKDNNDFFTNADRSDIRLVEASQASVTVSCKAGKYGTVIFPFTPDVSTGFENITFYSCSSVNGETNKAQLSEVLDAPAANTPYLIKNDDEEKFTKTLTGWGTASAASYKPDGSLLTGVYTNSPITHDVHNYVLQTQEGVQAFYLVKDEDFEATPYKCYLTYAEGPSVKAFYLDGDETAVSSVKADELQGATIYNLAGQRVSKAQKGVYIINGKKVAVK